MSGPLKIGDVVKLKTESPEMTVTDVDTHRPGHLVTMWFPQGDGVRPQSLVAHEKAFTLLRSGDGVEKKSEGTDDKAVSTKPAITQVWGNPYGAFGKHVDAGFGKTQEVLKEAEWTGKRYTLRIPAGVWRMVPVACRPDTYNVCCFISDDPTDLSFRQAAHDLTRTNAEMIVNALNVYAAKAIVNALDSDTGPDVP